MTPSGSRRRFGFYTKLSYGIGQARRGDQEHRVRGVPVLLLQPGARRCPALEGGIATFIALAIDAVFDPMVGSLSDSLRSRWGRRHPFMYAGAVPFGLMFYLLVRAARRPVRERAVPLDGRLRGRGADGDGGLPDPAQRTRRRALGRLPRAHLDRRLAAPVRASSAGSSRAITGFGVLLQATRPSTVRPGQPRGVSALRGGLRGASRPRRCSGRRSARTRASRISSRPRSAHASVQLEAAARRSWWTRCRAPRSARSSWARSCSS